MREGAFHPRAPHTADQCAGREAVDQARGRGAAAQGRAEEEEKGQEVKALTGRPFDQWRDCSDGVLERYGTTGDETCGAFNVPHLPTGQKMYVIASIGDGWEHVSVSKLTECPTWEQMVWVKRAFFRKDEWAMELHPPESKNISLHPYCLHLWRPTLDAIPLPPGWMVG
jgi:hypothetical protein